MLQRKQWSRYDLYVIKPPAVPQPWLNAGKGGGCPDQLEMKRVHWEQRHLTTADWLSPALQVQGD